MIENALHALNLTDYLAVFGSITGGTALSIQIYNFFAARPRCKIIPFNTQDDGYIFHVSYDADMYRENTRCSCFIQIENHSSNPITITRFYLSIPQYNIYHILSDSLIVASPKYTILKYSREKNGRAIETEQIIEIKDRQLIPPFSLPPYGAIQGSVFFVLDVDKIDPVSKASLRIQTTREELSCPITLLHPARPNQE